MHNLTFTQKLDNVTHIGIINKTENVVICRSCLLLRRHILHQVGDCVTLGLHRRRRPRKTACRRRIYTRRMIDEVSVKAAFLDFFIRKIPRELMHDRPYHLKVSKLLDAYVCQ